MTQRKPPLNLEALAAIENDVRVALFQAGLNRAIARIDADATGRDLVCVAKPGQRDAVVEALAHIRRVIVAEREDPGSGLVQFAR